MQQLKNATVGKTIFAYATCIYYIVVTLFCSHRGEFKKQTPF